MKATKLLFFMLVFSLVGCATVSYEYDLPPQALNAPKVEGKTRVIFYNDTNLVLFPAGTWRIGIEIDGVGVENLHLHKYVQLNLESGPHVLELRHVDIFTFKDKYDFLVEGEVMYVKVFNGLVSTKYEVLKEKPKNFENKYRSALE